MFWSQENFYLSGDIVFTPLTPKKAWIINSLITSVSYYIYTCVCNILSVVFYNSMYSLSIPKEYIIYGFLNLIPVVGITLFSTLSNVENTPIKQWVAAPVSLISLTFFIMLLFFHEFFPVNFYSILFLKFFGIILILLAFIINNKISNEKMMAFSDKLLSISGSRVID